MQIKVRGIVAFEKAYLESSKLVNIITKDYGVINVIAKGSKKIKSPLRCATNKLVIGEYNIYYKEDKLSTLGSGDVVNSLKNIQKDIMRISYASYLIELSLQVLKQSNNSIYDVLESALIKIDEGYDPLVITNIVELKYLSFLGVMPVLDKCATCGSKDNIATISSQRGGYVCNDCLHEEEIVSEKTIKLIRMFYYVDIAKISKLDISDEVKEEINRFLNEYYHEYTGLYLNSKNFINELKGL